MKIFTSYYAINGNHPRAAGISVSVPQGIDVLRIRQLAPDWSTLEHYKQDGDWEAYTKDYIQKLDALGFDKVLSLLKDGDVLLCYEKPPKNCHRHLLADWLRSHGVGVEEIGRS